MNQTSHISVKSNFTSWALQPRAKKPWPYSSRHGATGPVLTERLCEHQEPFTDFSGICLWFLLLGVRKLDSPIWSRLLVLSGSQLWGCRHWGSTCHPTSSMRWVSLGVPCVWLNEPAENVAALFHLYVLISSFTCQWISVLPNGTSR